MLDTKEFDRRDAAAREAERHLGFAGRCYGSMSAYRDRNPENLAVKNANVVTRTHGKLWWGDLDVTLCFRELRALAQALGVPVLVLREDAARFRTADNPRFDEASYATDWHDDDLAPTRAWAADEAKRRRDASSRKVAGP